MSDPRAPLASIDALLQTRLEYRGAMSLHHCPQQLPPRQHTGPQVIADVLAQLMPGIATRRAAAQQKQAEENVIFWPALARKLIALGHVRDLKLWLALHHLHRLAQSQPGWLPVNQETLERLAQLTGLSPITLRVLLVKSNGLAWHYDQSKARVYLVGQKTLSGKACRLATKAGIADPLERDWRCQMPLAALARSLEGFQAYLFDAWLGTHTEGLMLVWERLEALWGHTRHQLRRWVKQAGTVKQANKGTMPLPRYHPEDINELTYDGKHLHRDIREIWGFSHDGVWLEVRDNQVYLCWQRANTLYGSDQRTGRPGKAVHVNKDIQRCAGELGGMAITQQIERDGHSTHPDHPDFGVHAGQQLQNVLRQTNNLTEALEKRNRIFQRGHVYYRHRNYDNARKARRVRETRRAPDQYVFEVRYLLLRKRRRQTGPIWGTWRYYPAQPQTDER